MIFSVLREGHKHVMTQAQKTLAPIDDFARAELAQWLENNASELPEVVKNMFYHYNVLLDALSGSKRQLNQTLLQLQRALGIVASSEKRKSGDPIGPLSKPGEAKPKNKRERILLEIERSERLNKWHKKMARKHKRKLKDDQLKLINLEDIELTLEEEAELEIETEQAMLRTELGSYGEPSLEPPREAFMQGSHLQQEEVTQETEVSPASLEGLEIINQLY